MPFWWLVEMLEVAPLPPFTRQAGLQGPGQTVEYTIEYTMKLRLSPNPHPYPQSSLTTARS